LLQYLVPLDSNFGSGMLGGDKRHPLLNQQESKAKLWSVTWQSSALNF